MTMIKLPIKQIILDSVDCAGKTTLYKELHKATGFKYNIHDRSFLSMLCYSRLYNRDEEDQTRFRRFLQEEVCDLNNFYVIPFPPLDEIIRRFRNRGDEFQNEKTLRELYNIFSEEIDDLLSMKNVVVLDTVLPAKEIAQYIKEEHLDPYEQEFPNLVGSIDFSSRHKESQLAVRLEVDPSHFDIDVMKNEREAEYYTNIIHKCVDIIDDEYAGKNPYGTYQDDNSRRFYYSSNTCISSIHFLPRKERLQVLCTLRSTDVVKNGDIDTRFLAHLSALIPRTFGWNVTKGIDLVIRYNSAHIRFD